MLRKIALIAAIFIIGVFIGYSAKGEFRYPIGGIDDQTLSPSSQVSPDQIKAYEDKLVIELDSPIWARIKDTKSMEPVLNENSKSIEIKPQTPESIGLGDIISYEYEGDIQNKIIIHRVVELGQDNSGWFAITKGDNMDQNDPEKIRFDQVVGLVVGILY